MLCITLVFQMSERSILSRLVTSAAGGVDGASITASQQFPQGYKGGQLPGAYGASFAQFRPQYSVPGQQVCSHFSVIILVCWGERVGTKTF